MLTNNNQIKRDRKKEIMQGRARIRRKKVNMFSLSKWSLETRKCLDLQRTPRTTSLSSKWRKNNHCRIR